MSARIAEGSIVANGIRFGYLESGDGPLVVLLHGFPDNAWTWEHQLEALAGAGFRAVAPFLRGYPPTEVAGPSSPAVNAADAEALLRALSDGPAHLVGHDWGGFAAFGVMRNAPELVSRATVVASAHPATLLPIFTMPDQIHHAFHVWFFQIEGFSEDGAKANDLAFIDYLFHHMAGEGFDDAAHLERIKSTLRGSNVLDQLIPYYRSLVNLPTSDPDLVTSLFQPTTLPTMSVWGAEDLPRLAAEDEPDFFAGAYRREVVPGAGHYVHREQPDRFNELLLAWLETEIEARATTAR